MDASVRFGEALRSLRLSAGLTQEALAHRTGLSVDGISALERGHRRHPRADTLELLCVGLGLSPDERSALVERAARHQVDALMSHHDHPGWRLVPRQLPACSGVFAGRDDELATLTSWLRPRENATAPSVVAVVGMGGIGKTTLAVHAAQALAPAYPDGQVYLDLRANRAVAPLGRLAALTHLVTSLGVAADDVPRDVDRAAALFRSLVNGSRLLLVLDNAADAQQVEPLLPGAPGCGVIVTSRRTMRGQLDVHHFALDVLDPDASIGILRAMVGARRLATEPEATQRIVEGCDGLPLALRIVASRLAVRPTWPLSHVADRLAQEGARLSELQSGEVAVRTTIMASVDQLATSADPVDVAAAELHALSGALPATTLSATTMACLSGVDASAVDDALERLADVSLLDPGQPGRYRMHDLVHAVARERCGSGDEASARAGIERVLDLYVAAAWRTREISRALPSDVDAAAIMAPAAGLGTHAACLELLSREIDQVMAVAGLVATSVREGTATDPVACGLKVARLAEGLISFYITGAATTGWSDALRLGLEVVPDQALTDRGRLHDDLALALSGHGDNDGALGEARRAVSLFRLAGDRPAEASALGTEAIVLGRLGRYADAIDIRTAAMTVSRAHGDERSVAAGWRDLGLLHAHTGDLAAGIECGRRALRVYGRLGVVRGIAMAEVNLGVMLRDLGELVEARARIEHALTLFREVGDQPGETEALDELGYWHVIAGDPRRGVRLLNDGLALVDETGTGQWEARIRRRLAVALQRLGRQQEADRHWGTALRVHERRGELRAAAEVRELWRRSATSTA